MSIQDSEEDPIEYPITSEIDLHTFRPNEVSSLLGNILKNAGREKFLRFGSFMAKGQELCVRECIDF